jgi:hypothetical protein
MRVTLPSRLVTFQASDAFLRRNVPALRPIVHLSVSKTPEHAGNILALLLNVLLRLRWIQGVQKFMHKHLELLAATHASVKDDPWMLRLLRERVPVGSALKRRETQQPTLVAVQRKNVIFCHGSPFQAPP